MRRHHRCRQNHCHSNGFYEELQVLGCKSWSCRSIDILDILSGWSSADLHDVARFATVEAKTATRVFLHWVGAEEEVVVVEVMTGGEWNKDGLLVAAFSWGSRNCLHWLSSREVLRFHSAQVVGMGSSQ